MCKNRDFSRCKIKDIGNRYAKMKIPRHGYFMQIGNAEQKHAKQKIFYIGMKSLGG